MRLLSIAALQISPRVGSREATLEDFEHRVTTLRETFNELQMVVAPELHLAAVGGFFDEHPETASETAVEIPGALTERLGSLARATGLWLVPGSLYEVGEGEDVHNTAVVISPTGEI